jgi:hypothetical protein
MKRTVPQGIALAAGAASNRGTFRHSRGPYFTLRYLLPEAPAAMPAGVAVSQLRR